MAIWPQRLFSGIGSWDVRFPLSEGPTWPVLLT